MVIVGMGGHKVHVSTATTPAAPVADLLLFGDPPSRNRRFQRSLFSAARSDWRTPADVYRQYVPPCFDVSDRHGDTFSGLHDEWPQPWWCNPPYGHALRQWIPRMKGHGVALLPARTDTAWFHDHILGRCRIEFIRGRLYFGDTPRCRAPFPSMLCHFGEPINAASGDGQS